MKRLNYRTRLILGNTTLVLLLAVFFAVYTPGQLENTASDALRDRVLRFASIQGKAATAAILTEDQGGAEFLQADLEQAIEADPTIRFISVRRADGTTVAEERAEGFMGNPFMSASYDKARTSRVDENLHAGVPLVHKDKLVGSLFAVVSREAVTRVARASQIEALYISLAIFFVGVLVAYGVGRSVSKPVLQVAQSLDGVSDDLVSAARDQEASSAEEAAVVAETRQSMGILLTSAQEIAQQSSEVLSQAERSASGSKQVADRFSDLARISDRVAELLATIMQIADRADLLALNASLEGTRAGEAGKGFALVAAEMRRLAENIMDSVGGIRTLMSEMREASQAAADASESGRRSSDETAESARQIALLTQDQRQATEQVLVSMDEMNNVLKHTIESVQRSTKSAGRLADLSHVLSDLVQHGGTLDEADSDPSSSESTSNAASYSFSQADD